MLTQIAILFVAALAGYLAALSPPPAFDAVPAPHWCPRPAVEGPYASNTLLVENLQTIYDGQIHGPETVFFDNNGTLFTVGAHNGTVWRAGKDGQKMELFAFVGGEPLSGAFDVNGDLYLTVADKGLLKLEHGTGNQIVIANRAEGRAINYANDLALSSKKRKVYFTDSTRFGVVRVGKDAYNGFLPAFYEFYEAKQTGRVLEYNIETRELKVLLNGLWFANGIALSQDEDFLAIVDTFNRRLVRFWLEGPKAGSSEPFVENIPFTMDGLSTSSDGGFWLAFITATADGAQPYIIPYPWLRNFVASLPQKTLYAAANMKSFGGFAKVSKDGKVLFTVQDSQGVAHPGVTSVKEHEGKLYLGNLAHHFIGVIDLEKLKQLLSNIQHHQEYLFWEKKIIK